MAMTSAKSPGEMAATFLGDPQEFRPVGGHGLESVGRRHTRGRGHIRPGSPRPCPRVYGPAFSVTVSEPKAIFTPILFALLSLSMICLPQFCWRRPGVFVGRVEPPRDAPRENPCRRDTCPFPSSASIELSVNVKTVFDGISASPNYIVCGRGLHIREQASARPALCASSAAGANSVPRYKNNRCCPRRV